MWIMLVCTGVFNSQSLPVCQAMPYKFHTEAFCQEVVVATLETVGPLKIRQEGAKILCIKEYQDGIRSYSLH